MPHAFISRPRSLLAGLIVGAVAAGGLRVVAASPAALEAGRPVVRNFSPRDYEAHNQVFAITEAPSGLFYFGVYGNVLEFDGRTWRKIVIPTSWIRGLAAAPDGSIYVGATDEIGVCRSGADGLTAFTSLLPRLEDRLKPLGPVWSTAWHDGAAWFSTSKTVFRLRGNELRAWEFPPAPRALLHSIAGELILRRVGDAVYRLAGDAFTRLTDHEGLVAPMFAAFTKGDGRGLLALNDRGEFFHLEDGLARAWSSPLSSRLAQLGPRSVLRRHDGSLAVGTVAAGVLLANAAGEVYGHLTEASHGLVSDVTYFLHEDRNRGLWVTTYGGISRVELDSGLTLFDQRNGRGPTTTYDMVRWRDRLYIGANDSLYRLDPATTAGAARLTRVSRQSIWSNNLLVHDDALLVADSRGIQRFTDDSRSEVIFPTHASAAELIQSATDPARLFISTVSGLNVLRLERGAVVPEGVIAGHTDETQSMLEEPDGTLWLGTTQRGFVRARRRAGQAAWQDAELMAFTPGARGVPPDPGWCRVVPGPDGAPLFSTGRGAFVADAAREALVPAPAFVSAGKAGLYSHPLLAVDADTLYAQLGHADALDQLVLGRLVRRAGSWTWQPLPRAATETAGYLGAYHLHHERPAAGGDGVLWVSGRDALVRLDLAVALGTDQPAPAAQLRAVSQRTVGRWGASAGRATQPLRLAFSREAIEFTFAAPRYDAAARLAYQTRLRGYADEWSEWSPRGDVSFTNLSGGPFVFEVRARDGDGRVGPVARFAFSVAPPLHRSAAAFALYAAAAIATVIGFVRWRLRQAAREKERLEQLVAQRTEELRLAKNAADDASRAKSAFLANMSHELRTPLNGVIGYAQVLMKDRELSPRNRERLQIVQTSGEHLLRMINEVLDFSKIEAGRLELVTTPFHLPQLLRDIAAAISSRIEQKQLDFVFEPAGHLPDLVLGDPLKLRQVIDNLLGNAVKFTHEGSIRFETEVLPDEFVKFTVSDTGVGITAADRARLFQPFHQAIDGRPPEPGSGLGLAISQRLVELMGGKLEVETTPRVGSTFSFAVRLPVLAADAAEERRGGGTITGYAGRRRRILVVDDVAINRSVLRDLLSPLGFEIVEARSGAEALALVPQRPPDLVLLDLRMPGIDGFELARRLRERAGAAQPKLIAMSASVLSFNREDAFAAGCDDFLAKPFREDDLLARLGMALQLQWLGESGERSEAAAPGHIDTGLPAAVLDELLTHARRGEIAVLRKRLAQLPGDPLIEALEGFARRYRMENIRELLERHAPRSSNPNAEP